MKDFIKVQNVSFNYTSDDEEQEPLSSENVLDNISFNIEKGEFVAILGHNGCGKSTLAKLFNAMLFPIEGRVLVDGMDTIDEQRRYDIRKTVGLVLQNPDNQLVASIVEEDIAFGPENR